MRSYQHQLNGSNYKWKNDTGREFLKSLNIQPVRDYDLMAFSCVNVTPTGHFASCKKTLAWLAYTSVLHYSFIYNLHITTHGHNPVLSKRRERSELFYYLMRCGWHRLSMIWISRATIRWVFESSLLLSIIFTATRSGKKSKVIKFSHRCGHSHK